MSGRPSLRKLKKMPTEERREGGMEGGTKKIAN